MNEKVSIVLPTYNRGFLLDKAIRSCLQQTYSNIELIIVNDGSTDNTDEVVEPFLNDSRVIYLKKENEGLPKALNYGFQHATGEFFTWTSDDNVYKENAIEKMHTKLKKVGPGLVYTDYIVHSIAENKQYYVDLSECNKLFLDNYIGACFLYNQKVAEITGSYDELYKLVEDYDYWLRIAENFPLFHINEALYVVTDHYKTLTRMKREQVKIQLNKLGKRHNLDKRLIDDIQNVAPTNNIYIWGLGERGKEFFDIASFYGLIVNGIIDIDPEKQGTYYKGVQIYHPNTILTQTIKPFIVITSSFYEEIESILVNHGLIKNKNFYTIFNKVKKSKLPSNRP